VITAGLDLAAMPERTALASASDAEALAAFNETIECQARRRPGPA
jgi:hypothetical protein